MLENKLLSLLSLFESPFYSRKQLESAGSNQQHSKPEEENARKANKKSRSRRAPVLSSLFSRFIEKCGVQAKRKKEKNSNRGLFSSIALLLLPLLFSPSP